MLPPLVARLPEDRQRLGLRPVEMAGHLALTFRQYQALEAGDLTITSDPYDRICELAGWPLPHSRT